MLARNIRIFHTEVDILALSPKNDLCIFEVKSARLDLNFQSLISEKQKTRLKNVCLQLTECSQLPVRAHLLAVLSDDKIETFKDFLAD